MRFASSCVLFMFSTIVVLFSAPAVSEETLIMLRSMMEIHKAPKWLVVDETILMNGGENGSELSMMNQWDNMSSLDCVLVGGRVNA